MGETRSQQGRGKQRPKDQAGSLHGEDQCHEHATIRLPGVFTHDGRGNRVIPPDANAENEAESDQPPDTGRKRAQKRSGGENQHLNAVNALPPEHVRNTAEQQCAQSGGDERGGVDQCFLHVGHMPKGFRRLMTTPMIKRSYASVKKPMPEMSMIFQCCLEMPALL